MNLESFRPKPALVTNQTQLIKPRFPIIDAHNHLGEIFGGGWDSKSLNLLLERLDQAQIEMYVDLDGGWGEDMLYAHLAHFKSPCPKRFKIFGGVDWSKWAELGNGFSEWAARRLEIQKQRDAEGLKIWKPFGLSVRDHHGSLVDVDDKRLDPIWQAAGELSLPVMIHAADPVAFFDPLDECNERWEELRAHPDWHFPSPPFPSFNHILDGLYRLVQRHPRTTFIGAHVGCYAENLPWVARMLDACPNYFVDISARIAELGRQPYAARRFFLQYADRILFGLDMGPDIENYRIAYRFLETEDEYFSYHPGKIPPQGRWRIYGLHLPDEVLKKVYYNNAAALFQTSPIA